MKNKNYFGNEEEAAIRNYVLSSNPIEREKIYVEKIKPVFAKLVENIIFTYDFVRLATTYEDLHQEVMSHLYMNIDKFKPSYGKKAYSYFGTAAKRYLIQKSISKSFETNNISSIHKDHKDNNDIALAKELVTIEDEKNNEDREFISLLLKEFKEKQTDNIDEKKIIEAIVFFLEHYQEININNKKQMYNLLREYTGLETKPITKILNNYITKIYKPLKDDYINCRI
jgi:hypothetical protein